MLEYAAVCTAPNLFTGFVSERQLRYVFATKWWCRWKQYQWLQVSVEGDVGEIGLGWVFDATHDCLFVVSGCQDDGGGPVVVVVVVMEVVVAV